MAVLRLSGINSRARRIAYTCFGHLPPRVRRGVVGVVAPSFTVGALAVICDGDEVLFVTSLHRPGLALPGGLLKKGDAARAALDRELSEELGISPAGLSTTPDTAHVDPSRTRVDLIYFLRVDRRELLPTVGSEVVSYEWRRVDDPALTPQTREIFTAIADRIRRPHGE
jgi:8-oxo-dGTP pyrophosphatase MutT (NUDIX family)